MYHYTSVDTLIKYILPQKRLRFSRLDATNDPEERKWHICTGLNDAGVGDAEYLEFFKNAAYISCLIALNARVLCFSQDNDEDEIECMGRPYTGKGFARPRMWAQYAENHTGVCLVFDKKKVVDAFNEANKNVLHYADDVSYEALWNLLEQAPDAQRLNTSDIGKTAKEIAREKIEKYNKIYFFSKHKDWKEEHEFRLVAKPEVEQDIFLDIDGLMCGIILGDKFDMNVKLPVNIMLDRFDERPALLKFGYQGNMYAVSIV